MGRAGEVLEGAEAAGPGMGEWEETWKVLKTLYKNGERPPVMTFTSGTPPRGVPLLQDAQMALMSLGAGGAFKGERAYQAYYQDLQRDRANWLVLLALLWLWYYIIMLRRVQEGAMAMTNV